MKYKNWNVDEIKQFLNDTAKKAGVSVDGLPVSISKRMSSTKGACYYEIKDGNYKSTEFKFAKCLVDGTYPEYVVKEIIIHEYAHHYINTKTNKNQGHNKQFKETCRMLGIPDETYFKYSEIYETGQKQYRYKITCTSCGTVFNRNSLIGGTSRKTDIYVCGECRGKLSIEEY